MKRHHSATVLALAGLAACAPVPPIDSTTPPPTPFATQAPTGPTEPPASAAVEARFSQWLQQFRADALRAGIDEATLDRALPSVRYVPRVVELDRSQPEFSRAIWDYVDSIVSPARIAKGREKRAQWHKELDAAASRFGVPATVLLAVWGMESNYGTHYGNLPVLDALATLAFDGRREAWARGELLLALRIVQRGDMAPEQMLGSWAGAMGQTQFMPSIYLAHGIDGDGDGRIDIWGSMPDVFQSTAQFIARSGWRAQEVWGTEVQLPPDFDPARADPALRQSTAAWVLEGVRSLDGNALPALSNASLLLPAGLRGPAFLVGDNYRAILRYNNATSYALSVCLLAQRLAGGAAVQAPWPRDLRPLTRSEVLSLQTALNRRGFDSGVPDGTVGPATRKALQAFQRSRGLPADGYPTAELLELLQTEP
ncbi:lytic murein transglycosylase [Curvibacter sp. APW13]|uniref:lytic murein transglycosylase n=1 Tax=Curvibacter sp. APW13 TaxID=3077236 RepID=UPI0028E0910D|nr:lytic murein transglycosylase [Curvibacter sp. APW13]MDT8990385.1 lytic murein transglycosylase [Curvibacter sp. APW13]